MKCSVALTLLFFSNLTFSQTKATLDSIETEYQNCLQTNNDKCLRDKINKLVDLSWKCNRLIYKQCDEQQKRNLYDDEVNQSLINDSIKGYYYGDLIKKRKKGEIGESEIHKLRDLKTAELFSKRIADLLNKKPSDYSAQNYRVSFGGKYRWEHKFRDTISECVDLKIKEISDNKVEFRLYLNRGFPKYESVLVHATASVTNNQFTYLVNKNEKQCGLLIDLYRHEVIVKELGVENGGCIFDKKFYWVLNLRRINTGIPTDIELNEK